MSKTRYGVFSDFERILEMEYNSFGEKEMVDPQGLKKRMNSFPEHTLVLIEDNYIVSYISYALSNEFKMDDGLFGQNPNDLKEGDYCLIIGLATDEHYRHRGYVNELFKFLFETVKDKPILLTCHDYLVDFYTKIGFKYTNISSSSFNGDTWCNMTYNTNIMPK